LFCCYSLFQQRSTIIGSSNNSSNSNSNSNSQNKNNSIIITRTSSLLFIGFVAMTANAEARALLDQLMGVERDALLPAGKRLL
jgi:hypothetical protein